jgi:peptide/nickel transport system substrate-binding protein
MQNTFGLKDFFLYVLLLIVLVMVFLAMQQDDRRFEQMREASQAAADQQRTLVQIRNEIERLTQATQQAARGQSRSIEQLRDDIAELRAKGVRIETVPMPGRADAGSGASPGAGGSSGGADDERASGRTIADAPRNTDWMRLPESEAPIETAQWGFVNDPRDHEDFRMGGEFFELFEAQPPKLTPYLYSDVYGRRLVETVTQALGAYNPQTLKLEGVLAEAWQMDPDGMWLRVKIHDAARFSDGEPVTAEDVRWTFHDFVFNQELQTARFRSVLNVIDEVEAISEKVVEFRFVEPSFNNKREAMRMAIIPKHFYERFTPQQLNSSTGLLMGSGPYRLESLDPNNQWAPPDDLLLLRNENYWRDPAPAFDRFRYRVITTYAALLTSLTNGTGDMMRGTPEQFRAKIRDPEFIEDFDANQWINMRSGFSFIAWNTGERNGKQTPFGDKRVRQAMTLLLDRERIRRDFYFGLGAVATGPFPPASPQNNPDIEPWPYDIERAEELLTEAGWVDRNGDGVRENARGERFRFTYTHAVGSTLSPKIGAYLKDQCARVGIICEITPIDWAIFSETLDNRDFDAITMQWSQSHPESDPNQLWHSSSIPNQGDNFVQWSNAEADRLIEQGRATIDDDERLEVWHKLHTVIHEEQPYTFIMNPPWIRFVNKRIQNLQTYPVGLNKQEAFDGGFSPL